MMSRVRSGEIELLGQLFELHHRQLYRYFMARTSDRESSEDAVQEVFHRVLRYRARFRGEGSFGVWLYTIARNVLANHYGRRAAASSLEGIEELRVAAFDPILNESQRILHWALSQLEDGEREIVILSRFEELSMDDVGQIVGCSASTARVRLHRAILRLRGIYTGYTRTR